MIFPKEIHDSAVALAAADGGYVDETSLALRVGGRLNDDTLARWQKITALLPESQIGDLVVRNNLDEEIDLRAKSLAEVPGHSSVNLLKKVDKDRCVFFFVDRLITLLSGNSDLSALREIRVVDQFPPIRTRSCTLQPWDDNAAVPIADLILIDPRKYVRDLTGGNTVPSNVSIFLSTGGIETPSATLQAWKLAAQERLALTLVNEVWSEDGLKRVALVGHGTKKIILGTPPSTVSPLFEALHDSASWIYENLREIEIRHTLFTNELAREWQGGLAFYDTSPTKFTQALEAAKTAYRAHIRESSKETLRSLSDLRKALSEEISKVSSQTRDLISSLWKDFAIAATALLGRIALIMAGKTTEAESVWIKILLLGTAIFVSLNLVITLMANSKFMRIADESRRNWKAKLYGFLSEEDLRALSDQPLSESVNTYRTARNVIVMIYFLVVMMLIIGAWPFFFQALFGFAANLCKDAIGG